MKLAGIPQRIYERLQAHAEPEFMARQQFFSKEEFQSMGLRTADTHRVAKESYAEYKAWDADALLAAAESLLDKGLWEMAVVAVDWAGFHHKRLEVRHFARLKGWLETYVHTWAGCDHLCTGILGELLRRYPQFVAELPDWARNENRWMRRGAAVVTIPAFRKSADYLPALFQVVEILLPDPDDLVQKGYGWALKEACKTAEPAVYQFVLEHRATMPRTALRYAIEKMPEAMRAEAMRK